MKLSPILATLALFACAPAPGDDAAANATQAPAARGLEGEYVVTHVNEADPAPGLRDEEPTVTIAADRIHFQSQCIYQDWSYTRDGEDIQTGPFRYDEPPAMCARGLAIGETAIIEAIGAAETGALCPQWPVAFWRKRNGADAPFAQRQGFGGANCRSDRIVAGAGTGWTRAPLCSRAGSRFRTGVVGAGMRRTGCELCHRWQRFQPAAKR